ncbi:MAG: cellulase family glycosylhydrolase [Chloroflexi bacterium]|nr:cellulase family glycosylhydrolase [Chloroflexota bacterium]
MSTVRALFSPRAALHSVRPSAAAAFVLVACLLLPWLDARPASAIAAITIVSPITDQVLIGATVIVQASSAGASSATFSIDGGPAGALSMDPATGLWRASVNLDSVPAGLRNVTVTANSGASDTAWRVSFPGTSSLVATPSSSTAGPPSITILNPQSNHTYSGPITVVASAANAATVAFAVDGGARVGMDLDPTTGKWQAALNTAALGAGNHNVDVINTGLNGATVTDRAWSVNFTNATGAATPIPTPTSTPVPSQSPDTSAWGTNYSGAEFGASFPGTLGTDYIYPADSGRDRYFASRGLRLVRLPISWERLQHQANGPLTPADLAGVRSVLDGAAASGQKVIIDLHNFGRYYGTPLTVADAPRLANFWQQMAAALRGHPGLYGYELMNEPHDLPEGGVGWAAIAQIATNGVRQSDTAAWVLVPGYSWQTAAHWAEGNPNLAVQDSANHMLYSAHIYFDSDSSGGYATSYDANGAYPTIGVDRVQPFLGWLAAHNARGALTEYGVPGGDARWLTVLDNFLNVVWNNPNIVAGTYWSAGPWWGPYPLSVEPVNGQDRPQMSVLTKYPSR